MLRGSLADLFFNMKRRECVLAPAQFEQVSAHSRIFGEDRFGRLVSRLFVVVPSHGTPLERGATNRIVPHVVCSTTSAPGASGSFGNVVPGPTHVSECLVPIVVSA